MVRLFESYNFVNLEKNDQYFSYNPIKNTKYLNKFEKSIYFTQRPYEKFDRYGLSFSLFVNGSSNLYLLIVIILITFIIHLLY